jgi:sarcosine oxidase
LTADHVVWAAGCWTAQVFPELLRASVIQQDTYYYGAGSEWSSPPVPAWADLGAGITGAGITGAGITGAGITGAGITGAGITGAGNLAGAGFKVGLHEPGPAVALDGPRTADPVLEAHARAYLARRFPSLATARVVRVEVQHTAEVEWAEAIEPVALSGGVRIVRHPEHPSLWIVGDGSGSVFKTAPLIASRVAELLRRG